MVFWLDMPFQTQKNSTNILKIEMFMTLYLVLFDLRIQNDQVQISAGNIEHVQPFIRMQNRHYSNKLFSDETLKLIWNHKSFRKKEHILPYALYTIDKRYLIHDDFEEGEHWLDMRAMTPASYSIRKCLQIWKIATTRFQI